MKLLIPDDWDEEADGYACVFACIPNSPQWRATYRGIFYQLTWWHVWDKDTGSINGAKAIANQVFKELCMANCQDIIDQLTRIADALESGQSSQNVTKAIREQTTVLGSTTLNLDTPIPTNPDYTGSGVALPLNTLHSRFTMPDASIWNLYGEKNITETLETLFRLDAAYDLELYTNITSVLDSALKIGDANLIGLLKNFIRALVTRKRLPGEFGSAFEQLLEDDRLSVADILLMIATGDDDDALTISKAIKSINQTINLNNYNGCCDDDDCNCDEAETQTFNLLDLCRQDDQVINVNGNGQV